MIAGAVMQSSWPDSINLLIAAVRIHIDISEETKTTVNCIECYICCHLKMYSQIITLNLSQHIGQLKKPCAKSINDLSPTFGRIVGTDWRSIYNEEIAAGSITHVRPLQETL